MTQKKYALCYLGCHFNGCVKLERVANIVLAIISTGALAGLFISKQYRFVLTIILALAQVYTAARPYLPYENRIKELEKGLFSLNRLYLEIEEHWQEVSSGKLSDEDINILIFKFEKKWLEIDAEVLKQDALPRKRKYADMAEEEKNNYFRILYGEE